MCVPTIVRRHSRCSARGGGGAAGISDAVSHSVFCPIRRVPTHGTRHRQKRFFSLGRAHGGNAENSPWQVVIIAVTADDDVENSLVGLQATFFFFDDAARVSCDDGQRVRKVGGGGGERRRVDFPGEQRQLELRKDILLAAVSR